MRALMARVICAALALWPALSAGLAQGREASLRVRALDPTGAAIVAARVTVKAGPNEPQSLATNERGEALFTGLAAGVAQVRVEAEGFAARELNETRLKPGLNTVEARLNVAGVNEELVVAEDKQESQTDPRGNAFTSILTPDQIANLPDDPEEFEQALRQMAGPGAGGGAPVMRVNGFRGGKLPPKSQIREIRFRMNPYSADTHEADFVSIDILTKPGGDTWHGALNFGFRDESLNARNAFAPARGPEQNRRYSLSLDGPLWRNRTSLFLSADGYTAYDSKTIVAALPEGNFSDLALRPSRKLDFSARVEHATTKTHTTRFEYQRNALPQNNLGVGDFNLAERAYASDATEHLFRMADSGLIGKKLINDFRFQARWQELGAHSATEAPALLVLDAFNRGGAQVDNRRRERELEIADSVDFVTGKHSMKAGVLFEAGSYRSDDRQNRFGTFTFASLDDFRANRPTTFTRRDGDPRVAYTQYQFGAFFQDDIRLNKQFTLSLGLRHESQTNLKDGNNFAPRAGFAWSPFKDGKTTFRGGAGVFYTWFEPTIYEQTLRVDGLRQVDTVVRHPGFPDPFAGGSPIQLPPSRVQRADDLRNPYVVQSSFAVERRLPAAMRLMASYRYQRGVNLLRGHNVNAPVPGLGRPDPTLGNVIEVESTASSTLRMFVVGVNRFGRRFRVGVNYLWGKATNEADSPLALPADNNDLRGERGPASFDVRHRFFAMTNVTLPWGLRLGNIVQASSATPYNITTGFDDNGDSVSNDRPAGVGRNSGRGEGRLDVSARLSWSTGFGRRPESAQAGPRPRIVRIGGDSADILGSLPGAGAADRLLRLEMYAQASNLFNHMNPINFTGVQTSPFFGRPTAALPGRRMETGLRLSF